MFKRASAAPDSRIMDSDLYTDDEEDGFEENKKHYPTSSSSKSTTSLKRTISDLPSPSKRQKTCVTASIPDKNELSSFEKKDCDATDEGYNQLSKEIARLSKLNGEMTRQKNEQHKREQKKDDIIQNLKQLNHELTSKVAHLSSIQNESGHTAAEYEEQNRQLTSRLASEMNRKISANETTFENVSIQCRPMNIAEEYSNLCSNSWLDAKQTLDDAGVENEVALRILCDILMICHQTAEHYYDEVMSDLYNLMHNPLNPQNNTKSTAKNSKSALHGKEETKRHAHAVPQDAVTVIGDHFRRNADSVEITPLIRKNKEILGEKIKGLPLPADTLEKADVSVYVEESSRLTWKMAIQRPPMVFAQDDVNKLFKGEKEQPLSWGSRPSKNARVRFYQYPSLLHANMPMVKGKVFVK